MSKIIKIDGEQVVFDDGHTLQSEHSSDCCEHHWLDFSGLELADVSQSYSSHCYCHSLEQE